jgi:hypothetical protein
VGIVRSSNPTGGRDCLMPELRDLITSAAFGLVFACLVGAPAIVGVGGMALVRVTLVLGWLFTVVGTLTSMENASARHLIIAAIAVGIPMAVLLVGYERFIVWRVKKKALATSKLAGDITCFNTRFVSNTYQDRIMAGSKWYDHGYDCAITLHVRVTSDSALPATVTSFSLCLIGLEYFCSCSSVPVDGLVRERKIPRLGGPPHKVVWEPLKPFPLNKVITNTVDQEGWLRFHCSVLVPPDREGFSGKQLRLVAFDGRRESHAIYEGTVQLPECEGITDAANAYQ